MLYEKKENILYLKLIELRDFYWHEKISKIRELIEKKSYNLFDLNYEKKREVAEEVKNFYIKRKEEVELFYSMISCFDFFGDDSYIGFVLKDNYNLDKDLLENLTDLKEAIKENSIIDFLMVDSDRNVYNFQLKQYKKELKTEDFIKFLNKILKKYGYNIEGVHLLIVLQGPECRIMLKNEIDFKKVKIWLKNKKINFKGVIMARFNVENKWNFLVELYPGNNITKTKIDPNNLAGKFFYK